MQYHKQGKVLDQEFIFKFYFKFVNGLAYWMCLEVSQKALLSKPDYSNLAFKTSYLTMPYHKQGEVLDQEFIFKFYF